MISLSFDTEQLGEGDRKPIDETVPSILDLLDRYQIKGTFFVVGETAEHYPELIKDINNRGHEVGSHAYLHESLEEADEKKARHMIRKGKKALEDIVNSEVTGYRSPYLHTPEDYSLYDILRDTGFKYSSTLPDTEENHNLINRSNPKIREIFLFKLMDWVFFEDESWGLSESEARKKFHQTYSEKIEENENGVIGMHPWVINSNPERLNVLEKIIQHGKDKGVEFVTCREFSRT